MRTTIDLPEDIHRLAQSLARHRRSTLSQAVVDLINRGLAQSPSTAGTPPFDTDPVTGLPVVHSSRLITPEDVGSMEDEP